MAGVQHVSASARGIVRRMVSNGMSKARQQKIVGEGLAVGVLSLGVEAVTSNKQAVEFAFRRAWRGWSCNSLFPQIHASVVRNDIVGIMHRSSNRSGMITADWTSGREHVPTLREAWPIEEAGEAVGEEAGVSHAQWVDLARAFIAEFKPEEVPRSE